MPKERTRETRVQADADSAEVDFVAEHGMDLFMEEGELPAWERFAAAILGAHVARVGLDVSIGDVTLISGAADFMVAARRRHVYELVEARLPGDPRRSGRLQEGPQRQGPRKK